MKVCVIGGTGNISTSIVQLLLELGHDVTCFNRGQRGTVPPGARVVNGDRLERDAFEQSMQSESFDAAIDMICFNREDALSDIRAFPGVTHFIQVSTVCTYGVDYDWLPVTEDHPLRPITDYGRNKVAADAAFMAAYHSHQFPVTIIKPSTTYGPQSGVLRQVAWDLSWLQRITDGRPILICGDGNAIHQFLHVDDAALGFAHMLGRAECVGQTYNLVRRGFTLWKEHHRVAMEVLGHEAELVGVNTDDLEILGVPDFEICRDIFSHNCYYSGEKLCRDVPEFAPRVSLAAGTAQVYSRMLAEGRVPVSEPGGWEDRIIQRLRSCRTREA
jgi:nucleoside-diphosphate-sugar epimerase